MAEKLTAAQREALIVAYDRADDAYRHARARRAPPAELERLLAERDAAFQARFKEGV